MENNNIIISVEEKEKENAKALTQSFTRKDVKSRAYTNAIGAEVLLKYLEENHISSEPTYNLHSIRKILEEFDISDVMLSNIHIDARIIYDEEEIFIPKSHFEYNITPDIYVVFKIAKDYSKIKFLGFFEPKMINKNNSNENYYFIEKEKLSSPSDLKSFIEDFKGNTSKEYSEEEMNNAELLIVSMADNNIGEKEKTELLGYLKESARLRDYFIEFENFEMLAYQATSLLSEEEDTSATEESPAETEETVSEEETQNSEEVTAEENAETEEPVAEESAVSEEAVANEDITITEELTPDIVEAPEQEESGMLGDILEGTAVVGAEIAGAAMASAALTGAAESAEIAKDTAETAINAVNAAAELTENLLDGTSAEEPLPPVEGTISEPALENAEEPVKEEVKEELPAEENLTLDEDIFGGALAEEPLPPVEDAVSEPALENAEEPVKEEVKEELPAEENLALDEDIFGGALAEEPLPPVEDAVSEPALENTEEPVKEEVTEKPEEQPAEESSAAVDEQGTDDSAISDDLSSFLDDMESSGSQDASFEDLFSGSDSDSPADEDSSFGLSTDDITFSNNDDSSDEIVFGNGEDDDYDDLVFENNDDYDDFGGDDSSPTVTSGGGSSSGGGGAPRIAPTMRTPISQAKESDLISLENIKSGNIPPSNIPMNQQDMMETMEMDEFHKLVDNYVAPVIKDESPMVDFNEISPDADKKAEEIHKKIQADKNKTKEEKRNEAIESDAFVQDMPEELADSAPKMDEISSDNFVEDLPEDIKPAEVKKDTGLNSDSFVEEMPENVQPADVKKDEITSDNFVEDLPELSSDMTISEEKIAAPSEELSLPEDISFDDGLVIGEIENELNTDAIPDITADEIVPNAADSADALPDDGGALLDDLSDFEEGSANESMLPDDVNSQNGNSNVFNDLDDISGFDNVPKQTQNKGNLALDNQTVQTPPMAQAVNSSPQLEEVHNEQPELISEEQPVNQDIPQDIGALDSLDNLDDFSQPPAAEDNSQLGILYQESAAPDFNNNELAQNSAAPAYNYQQKKKGSPILPVFALLAVVAISGLVVGFMMKNKNSIEADTLIQPAESGTLANPETDNTGILADNNIEPAIPAKESSSGAVVADIDRQVKQEMVKDAKNAIKSNKPLNSNKSVSLKNMSWEVPDYLSYSDNIKKYLQTAGKSIKLTLTSDLLLTNDYIYANQVKVNAKLSKDGTVQNIQITRSSGSSQVDQIVLQTVKNTLNAVKPPAGEVPTETYNLGLIIYL